MMKRIKENLKTSCLLIAVGLSMTVGYYACFGTNSEEQIINNYDLVEPSLDTNRVKIDTLFSEAALKQEIMNNNIKHSTIVLNQAKLETGYYKSHVFKKYNNLFGFVGKKGYIKYINWQASVKDYRDWQNQHYKGGDYYKFLKNIHYAEDSLYISKLRRMI